MALTRYSGLKAKELRERLGDPATLPTVEQAQSIRKEGMTEALQQMKRELVTKQQQERKPFRTVIRALRTRQREERTILQNKQSTRTQQETLARADRLRKGIVGLWDRLTGHRGRTVERNTQEQAVCQRRDQTEHQKLVARHLQERRDLQNNVDRMKEQHTLERQQLRSKMGFLFSMDSHAMRDTVKAHMKERDGKRQEQKDKNRGKGRGQERTRSRGPDDPSP